MAVRQAADAEGMGRTSPWAGRFRGSGLCYSRCVGFTVEQSVQSRFSTCTLRVSQLLG